MKTLLSRYFDTFNLKYNDDEIENLSHELTNYGHFLASESPVDYIHFNPREEFIHYTASNYPKEHHYLSEEFTKYYQSQYHFVSDYIVNRIFQKSLMITINKDICFVNPRYQVKISLCFGFSPEYNQYIYEWFKDTVNFVAMDLVLVKEPL